VIHHVVTRHIHHRRNIITHHLHRHIRRTFRHHHLHVTTRAALGKRPLLRVSTRYSTSTTRRGQSKAQVLQLWRTARHRRGYCTKNVATFRTFANKNRGTYGCGGANRNLAYKFSFAFWTAGGYRYQFRIGSDFGRGGMGLVDGRRVVARLGQNLWWHGRWNSRGVLTTPWRRLTRGRHRVAFIGFEGCCDGAQSVQFRRYGGRWQTVSASALWREARRGPYRRRVRRRRRRITGHAPILFVSTRQSTQSTRIGQSSSAVLNMFRRSRRVHGYCHKRVHSFRTFANHLSGARGCGGSNRNIAYKFKMNFWTPGGYAYRFRIGSDFGRGGQGTLDGRRIISRLGTDLWWNGRWNSHKVMTTRWSTLSRGRHRFTWVGFEGCCDGAASLQYQIRGVGGWRTVNRRNLILDTRRRPYRPVRGWRAARMRFETRFSTSTTRRGMSYFQVKRLFHRASRRRGYCSRSLTRFTMRSNQNTCRGSRNNIGYRFSIDYYTNSPARWQWRIGSDFGRGGVIAMNGRVVAKRLGQDLWWHYRWASHKVMTGRRMYLGRGLQRVRFIGFENCCDGKASIQYRRNNGPWKDASVSNLNRDTRRTASARYTVVRVRDWTGRYRHVRVRLGRSKLVRRSNRYRTNRHCPVPYTRSGVQVNSAGRVRAWFRYRCSRRQVYGHWVSGRGVSVARYGRFRVTATRWTGHRRRVVHRRGGWRPMLTFSTKQSTFQTRPGQNARALINVFRRSPRPRGFCRKRVSSFTSLSNHGRGPRGCGGPNRNIAYMFRASFYTQGGYNWRFRIGSDFGRGGLGLLDGRQIVSRLGQNLWWRYRWQSRKVMTTPWRRLGRGRHLLEFLGFEGCCDGSASIQYQLNGGRWKSMSTGHLIRDARRRRIVRRRVRGMVPVLFFATRYSTARTTRSMSGRTVQHLYARSSQRRGYCRKRVFSMNRLSNHGRGRTGCGGSRRNIAFRFYIRFYNPRRQNWRFRIGSDFGKGGVGILDGRTVVRRIGRNLWWRYNWRNSAVMSTPYRSLTRGWHTMVFIGFENCCDGAASVQYQVQGRRWKVVNSVNLYRESIGRVVRRRVMPAAPPSPPRGTRTGFSVEAWHFPYQLRRLPTLRHPMRVWTDRRASLVFVRTNQFMTRQSHQFAMRYRARVWAARRGWYYFYLTASDGAKFWVDHRFVINNDGVHGARTRYGRIRLNPGFHDIRVDFFKNRGPASLKLEWRGPRFARQVARVYQLSRRAVARRAHYGYKASMWNLRGRPSSLVGLFNGRPRRTYWRSTAYINFNQNLLARYFHTRSRMAIRFWTSTYVTRPGSYTFWTRTDDGSSLSVHKGNRWRRVVNNDGLHPARYRSGRISLTRGYHNIRIDFFQNQGHALIQVFWAGPGFGRRLMPAFRPRRIPPTPPNAGCNGPVRTSSNRGNSRQTVCCGTVGTNGWRRYGGRAMYVQAVTSRCRFVGTPRYFTTISGVSWHWRFRGTATISAGNSRSFRAYVYNNGMYNWRHRGRWTLNWCGVGKVAAPRRTSKSTCCGTETSSGWRRYGAHMYSDINMRRCGFTATPKIMTSLSSTRRVLSAGVGSVYAPNAAKFRMYIYGTNPARARAYRYKLRWCAVGPARGVRRGPQYPCNGARVLNNGRTRSNTAKVCCGTQSHGWQNYYSNGVKIRVNTGRCRFAGTPIYFSNVRSNTHHTVSGANAYTAESRTGFNVYLKASQFRLRVNHATAWRYAIQWCGVSTGSRSQAVRRPPGPYHLRGEIKNAVTGGYWTGPATVTATKGRIVKRGVVRRGRYDIAGVSTGRWVVKVTGAGFCAFQDRVTIARSHARFNINVSPTLRSNQLRIVLTWGAVPRDLDSHLLSPNRCKTYYANRRGCTGVTLDKDVTGGYGPETMTIHRPTRGWYHYKVHNYSRVSANVMRHGVSNTPATVTVYKGCRRRVFICGRRGDGNINPSTHYWDVFKYNGGTGQITR